ncbi:twitching motility protein PilT [Sulfolobus sp. A20]|uniref:PIN domain-containing protein n=1 Tax=Saccharolobus sp. A20 TaxID=1891280 RepID=UPI000845D70C|nr:PIN domain-containing protein [Sulfolobus sp. A20]TRM74537.1 type II toxin-antitoxin system VapC family toxin [Sulfolobus sp. A20-N-F8]TRM76533.1 type II toxin-antitoxin system VapC family toxin [Sulfolobus sp. E5]TRM78987.1 type II toxin-antitoxin system VapC family toxin [Sulfolobus sp. B5]TRM81177.1 type II toxin-antitoxin system VapC family toxin [Sulfolobus sp. D5]TRM84796.1 type II toxin-antitoxin system VapC family toxin [Sulfolobus sp. F3]TRM87596.1 type II toxin-antitoxin system V
MKVLVDTNVIIFDLIEDSQFHKEAEELLDIAETWVIPSIVIHELVWFLRANNLEDLEYVTAYLGNPKAEVVCDDYEVIRKAFEIMTREGLSLSRYNDVVILSHAILRKLPLATFDKRLSSLAKKYGINTV